MLSRAWLLMIVERMSFSLGLATTMRQLRSDSRSSPMGLSLYAFYHTWSDVLLFVSFFVSPGGDAPSEDEIRKVLKQLRAADEKKRSEDAKMNKSAATPTATPAATPAAMPSQSDSEEATWPPKLNIVPHR